MVLKDARIWPWVLLYGATYLGLDVVYRLTAPHLGYDSTLAAYVVCLCGAAVFTSRRFQQVHGRTLTDPEGRRLTHRALLVTSLITVIDTLLLVGRVFGLEALRTPMETFHQTIEYPALLAGTVLVFVLFSYGLLRLAFGRLSRWGGAVPVRDRPCSPAVTD